MKRFLLMSLFILNIAYGQETTQTSQETQAEQKTQTAPKHSETQIAKNKSGFVIGIFGGASFVQAETEYDSLLGGFDIYDRQKLSIGPNYGIKLGYDVYFLPQHGMRIYVDYMGSNFLDNNNIVGKVNTHNVALNIEYKFDFAEKFGLFAGLNANYTIFDTQKFGSNGRFGFGINAGFTYTPLHYLELELGVKYLGDTFKEKIHNPDSLAPTNPNISIYQKTDLSDLIGVRFGINFKI